MSERIFQMEYESGLVEWLSEQKPPQWKKKSQSDTQKAKLLGIHPVVWSQAKHRKQKQLLPPLTVAYMESLRNDEELLTKFLDDMPPKQYKGRMPGALNKNAPKDSPFRGPRMHLDQIEHNRHMVNLFKLRWNLKNTSVARIMKIALPNLSGGLYSPNRFISDELISRLVEFGGNVEERAKGNLDHRSGMTLPLGVYVRAMKLNFDLIRPHLMERGGDLPSWAMRGFYHYHLEAVESIASSPHNNDFFLAAAYAERIWTHPKYLGKRTEELSPLYYERRLEAEKILLPYVPEDAEAWRWNDQGIDISHQKEKLDTQNVIS